MPQQSMSLLPAYLLQVPQFLVWLIGILLALRNLRRYPRPAVLTLIGAGLALVVALVSIPLTAYLPIWLHARASVDFATVNSLAMLLRVVFLILNALAWLLILLAVFTARRQPPEPAG
jgi:hypothetical protein